MAIPSGDCLVNDRKNKGKRKLMSGELLRVNHHTAWVRLADGTHIKRKLRRDMPDLYLRVLARNLRDEIRFPILSTPSGLNWVSSDLLGPGEPAGAREVLLR